MKPLPLVETDDGVDLTPMIDIVFLLIVFFMTVAQMEVEERVPIEIPVAEQAVIPEERGLRMTITLKADGQLFFGSQPASIEDLPGRVAQARQDAPDIRLYLRADAGVPYRDVREIFRASAEGGVPNVIFATHQSDN